MLNCHQIDPLVTPYVDHQLPDSERRLVDDHLRACAPCHSRVAAEQAVHTLVSARRPELRNACAPSALRTRCRSLCAEARATSAPKPPTPQRSIPTTRVWTSRLGPLAMAASLVVVVGGAFVYQATHLSARVLAAELAADHVKCFAMNAALGTHQGPASVESAMLASFNWRMHLPANAERAGLELVGARPCLYGEGKIAHIMYRHQGQAMSLFMLPSTERSKELVEVLGHEAAIWCEKNRTFVLVSREPRAEVERIASFVQASLQ